LAFVNEAKNGSVVFDWLLALSGVANFFVYGSICVAHIRFRSAWKYRGHSIEELPFRAQFGIWGSYLGLLLNFLCLAAQFYTALYPIGGSPNAEAFFESYLAAPVIIALYAGWKIWSMFKIPENRPMWVAIKDIDLYTGMREGQFTISAEGIPEAVRRQSIMSLDVNKPKKWYDYPKGVIGGLF